MVMEKYTQHKYGFYLYTGDSSDEQVQMSIKNNGEFEHEINNWIVKNVKPGWLVYDLGANIGEISEMAAMMGAKVYAFEAQKQLCDAWVNVRKDLGAINDITIYNIALSDKNEKLKFYTSLNNLGGSSFSEEFVFETEPESFINRTEEILDVVPMSSLDLPDQVPDLIKLDIQDWEEKAWDGMPSHIQNAKNVIAEVLHNTQDSILIKYLDGRSAYLLDGTLITRDNPQDIVNYVKDSDLNYVNFLFS
jgi:FkbM family methyltransferase